LYGYVRSVQESLKFGCYDWVFNPLRNSGVNADGDVIMMDFGEIGMDKGQIGQLIADRAWEKSYDYTHEMTESQQSYLRGLTRSMLNQQSLDQLWQTALH
jgi:hypothetical protein